MRPRPGQPRDAHDRMASELALIRHALFVLVRRQLGNMTAEEEAAALAQVSKLSADLKNDTAKLVAEIDSQ